MPCKPQVSKVFSIVGIVLGAAIVVAGAIMPTIIESLIEQSVKSMTKIDHPTSFASKDWTDYVKDERFKSFYFYHVTNLWNVLHIPATPLQFQEKGPYRYKWTVNKVAYSFNAADTEFTYEEWEEFACVEATCAVETEQLTVINPLLVGASAVAGGWPNLLMYAVSSVIDGLYQNTINETSQMVLMNKFLATAGVLGIINNQMALAVFGGSSVLMRQHWQNSANLPGTYLSYLLPDIMLQYVRMWELDNPNNTAHAAISALSLSDDTLGCLFNYSAAECSHYSASLPSPGLFEVPSSPTGGGIYFWLDAVMQLPYMDMPGVCTGVATSSYAVAATCVADYLQYFGLTHNEVKNLAMYLYGIAVMDAGIPPASNQYIFPLYSAGYAPPLCGAVFPASWEDVSACQWGSSGVTMLMAKSKDPLAEMYSLSEIPGLSDIQGAEDLLDPFEWIPSASWPSEHGLVLHPFSMADSKAFLLHFSDKDNMIGEHGVATIMNPYYPGSDIEKAQWIITNHSGIGIDFNNIGNVTYYLLYYVPEKLLIHSQLVGAETTVVPYGARGNGLFMRKSVHDLIFGFDYTPFGIHFSGTAGRTWATAAEMLAYSPRPGAFDVHTGKDDVKKLYEYVKWKGVSVPLSTPADIPWTLSPLLPVCMSQAGQVVPNSYYQGHRKDCKIWNTPEEMRGATGGQYYGSSFNEGDDPKERVTLTVSSVYRKVDTVFKREEELKGVKVWRYILDPEILKTDHPTAANYWMDECDGLLPLRSAIGVPMYASLAGFGAVQVHGGDGTAYQCTGVQNVLSWDDGEAAERHETYIQFDPLSGMALGYRLRLQMSVKLEKNCLESPLNDGPFCNNFAYGIPAMNLYDYYTYLWSTGRDKLFIPFTWAEEEKEISDDDANTYTDSIYGNRDLGSYLLYSLVPVGTVILIASVVILLLRLRAPVVAAATTA